MPEVIAGRVIRNASEVEALAAGYNRRWDLVRLGRREHEDGVRRRLFEGLQESVPGRPGQLVRLVDDVHPKSAFAGSILDFLAQVTDIVDAPVGGRVDLDQVEC